MMLNIWLQHMSTAQTYINLNWEILAKTVTKITENSGTLKYTIGPNQPKSAETSDSVS